MKKQIIVALFVLAMASLACSMGGILDSTDTGSDGGNVLWSDDFSSDRSGWAEGEDEDGSLGYVDGGYRIQIDTSQLLLFASSKDKFQSDVKINIDATKVGGPDDNYYGLICRYQDEDNFYFFLISSDGYAGIGMYLNDEMQVLSGENMEYTDAINQGEATNTIGVDCIGDQLTLYVNGQQVASAVDSSFTNGGEVGLAARSNDEAGVVILFDNLVVSKP